MINKVILFSGSSAVGKTSLMKHLITLINRQEKCCACKIDCIHTEDHLEYAKLGVPSVCGISNDICPDHYLASNMEELIAWGNANNGSLLFIETAGLCHRCCPATEKTINICVTDCTASSKAPQKLGPMLTTADSIALTKIDLISQAEKEILMFTIKQINQEAKIYPIDGLFGYGVEILANKILASPSVDSFIGDKLRSSMPSGVCSYCIGEQRIGSEYQQGVVQKICLEDC